MASKASFEDSGPSPMDIGATQGDDEEGDAEEYVSAIGKGSRECSACGEQGHFWRYSVSRAASRGIMSAITRPALGRRRNPTPLS